MGSVYKRGSVWWVKYYRHGRPFRESSNSPKITEAKHLLALREGQVVEGRFAGLKAERILFDELATDYLREYRIHGRKAIKDAERYARVLLQAFGGRRAIDVTSDAVQTFIDRRRNDGAANGTLNKELGALRRMFTIGARQQPPKVIKVPPIPRFKETNVRRGFFEHDAFLALRGALPDHQKVPLTLAYWTGMRKGEILQLQWDQLDWDRHILRLHQGTTKNDEGRVIPVVPDLLNVLTQWRHRTLVGAQACPWICHYDGQPLKRLTRAWKTACKKIGLEGKLFHDLRRTGVRNLVRAGVPEAVAMKISGHKTRSIFDRYNIVTERDVRDAGAKLAAYFNMKSSVTDEWSATEDGHVLGTVEAP